MAISTVKVTAKSLENRKKRLKYTRRIVIILFILLLLIFFILSIIYKGGKFTVTLDPNFTLKSGIVLFDSTEDVRYQNKLYAKEMEFMDNISGDWIPKNIDTEAEGSHNGENYIAYTFYVGNKGEETINYWYRIRILDVIKNVDEAIRIRIYLNGNLTTYAKINELTGEKEEGTEEFYSKEYPVLAERKGLKAGENDRFTIVIYLEGNDPDCVDAIIGGELKLAMEIMEEHIDNEKKK